MYSRLVCFHYAFGNQRKSGLDENMSEDYTSLAYKYAKIKIWIFEKLRVFETSFISYLIPNTWKLSI